MKKVKRIMINVLIFIFGVLSAVSPFFNSFVVKRVVKELTSETMRVTEPVCVNIFGAVWTAVVNYTEDFMPLTELICQLGIIGLFLITWFKMTFIFFKFIWKRFTLKLDDCDLFLGFMLDLAMFYLSVIIMSFSTGYIFLNNVFLLTVFSQTGFAHFIRKADVVIKF